MGIEELRELLDAGAVEDVERSLRPVPRNADELHDLLRRAGHLLPDEADPGFTETLLRERRAIRFASGARSPARSRGRGRVSRRARGRSTGRAPGRVPRARPGRSPRAAGSRCKDTWTVHDAGCRSPTSSRSCASRGRAPGSRGRRPTGSRRAAARRQRSASGAIRTSSVASAERRSPCCGARSSRRSRERSGASSRRGTGSVGARRFARLSSPSRRSRFRSPLGERRAAAPRAGVSSRGARRALRIGRGRLGWRRSRSRRALLPEDAPLLGSPAAEAPPEDLRTRPFGRRSSGERSSGRISLAATDLEPVDALAAVWDLVWSGEVTNDSWAPLRASRRYEAPAPSGGRGGSRVRVQPCVSDAGSLVSRLSALHTGGSEPEAPTAVLSRSCSSSGRDRHA